MSATSDRNLLFGLLALQMDFLSRDALLDGMHAWMTRKSVPLAQVLQDRGALADEDRQAVELLLRRHLARHGGDEQKSLAAVRIGGEVRAELASLADAGVRASASLLTTPAVPSASPLAAHPLGPGAPSRYRKLRPHARGGLGEVSVALDEELRREVALKEVQSAFADVPEYRARFLREAEITGHLEHPGIVPVYGLGAYPDGRPYYAMRFIRGESLHEAIGRFHQADEGRRDAGERELSLRALLARFVAVCYAVAYAHSRGIVHRDLKPANVMLGEYGETLVVDWGLAKAVTQPDDATTAARPVALTALSSTATELGQVVGTPAFMPPEQARGELEKVNERSDVFALGATLYCLLTGKPPYERDGVSLLAAAAAGEHAPARRLNRRVPTALDAVCARAMAARPEDRYGTARQLAADVERWLADEPVEAMPEPASEKARRWVKRNRTLVASSAALLLASVAGLVLGLVTVGAEQARTRAALDEATTARREAEANLARALQAERESKERLQLAEANFQLARQAVDASFGIAKDDPLLDRPDLGPDLRELRRKLLEKALPFYQRFRAQRPGDVAVNRDTAEQFFRVAYIQNELGHRAEALGNSQRAVEALRALVRANPRSLRDRSELAGAVNNHGVIAIELGKKELALNCLTEVIALYRELEQSKGAGRDPRYQLTHALSNLGVLYSGLGRMDEARAAYDESIARGRALRQARPDVLRYSDSLASALANRGLLEKEQGRSGEGMSHWGEAIALLRGLVRALPTVPRYQSQLAGALTNLGRTRAEQGQRDEALRLYHEAARLARGLVSSYPNVPHYTGDLGVVLNNLGALHLQRGKPEEALACLQEAVALARSLITLGPTVPQHREKLVSALNNLGELHGAQGRRRDAVEALNESVRLSRELVAERPDDPSQRKGLVKALNDLGLIHRGRGDGRQELAYLLEAAEHARALARLRPNIPRFRNALAVPCNNLGWTMDQLGKGEEAVRFYTEAIYHSRPALQAEPDRADLRFDLARPVLARGSALRKLKRYAAARKDLDEALFLYDWLEQRGHQVEAVTFLRFMAHFERAITLAGMGLHSEAVFDWDNALKRAPGRLTNAFRLLRANSLARTSAHARAAAEAAAVARQPRLTATIAYNAARVFALSAASASRDNLLPLPRRERVVEARCRSALTLLELLIEAGFFRDPDNHHALRIDADINFLRDRDDFEALVASLPKPAK